MCTSASVSAPLKSEVVMNTEYQALGSKQLQCTQQPFNNPNNQCVLHCVHVQVTSPMTLLSQHSSRTSCSNLRMYALLMRL